MPRKCQENVKNVGNIPGKCQENIRKILTKCQEFWAQSEFLFFCGNVWKMSGKYWKMSGIPIILSGKLWEMMGKRGHRGVGKWEVGTWGRN